MNGVTVRLAGSFSVLLDSTVEAGPSIGSRKARRLLVLLAVHRGGTVTVDRIVDALWDGAPPQRPAENVATLVSRLRATLGADTIGGGRDGYRLGSGTAVDLDEVARLVAESGRRLVAGEPGPATSAASRALELLGDGPALADQPDVDWVLAARSEHERLLRDARHAAAAAALRAGDPQAARDAAGAAVAADRLDETAHRLLMSAHQAAGEPVPALAIYEQLRGALATELGVDPAPETRELHLALLREQRPPRVDPPPVREPGDRLAGRADEVNRLGEAWSAATLGRGAVLLITGEGGIGKTRLAAEAIATAESTGGQVLQARCYASERSLFLQPIVDALAPPLSRLPPGRLRELAGARSEALAGLLPELVSVLGPAGVERASPEIELRRVYEGVTGVLRGMAAERPALLLLDDLHNAGLATVELLHYLARHLTGARIIVLATIRAEEGQQVLDALAEVATRLDLGPLPADAVLRLAAAIGRSELAGTIMHRTRGHTLFVVETLRGFSAGETAVPESLQTVVLARLRRAGPAVEELLRAGAVLGASVDPALVAGMLDLPLHVAAHRCEQGAAVRLLHVAGRSYEFANDLIQEVLYATTPEPTRLAYHSAAADLLAGSPEAVAVHATALQDWARAARAFLLAAEQAAARWATADAGALADRALLAAERADRAELVGRAYLARGLAREHHTDYDGALDDFHAALDAARQAGDRRLEMLALRQSGGHSPLALGASVAECTDRLREGLLIAESLGDRAVEANTLGYLAVIATNRLRFAEAVELGRRAALAGHAAGDDVALAVGLDGLKTAYAYLGDLASLRAVLDELLPVLRRLGSLELLQWAVFESAFPAIGGADWASATASIDDAIEVSRRSGLLVHESWFVAHLGWLARLRGRHDEAVEHGRQAVTLTAQSEHRWFRPSNEAMLAGTLLERGDRIEAVRLLIAALEQVEREGAEAYRLRCLAPLAEATGSREQLAEADGLLAGITAPADSAWLLGADCYLSVARAWLLSNEPERARAVLRPLLAAAERQQWLPALAAGGLVDGRAAAALGDPGAGPALSGAAELAARHGMPTIAEAARQELHRLDPGQMRSASSAAARAAPSGTGR